GRPGPQRMSQLVPRVVSSSVPPRHVRRAGTRSPHERLEEQMLGRLKVLSSRATASTLIFVLLGGLGGGCGASSRGRTSSTAARQSASALAPIHGTYSPSIDPANFVATVDNRYWPLEPGTGFHYQGVRGKTPQTDDALVTRKTKRILGITCAVVRDTVSEHGRPIERTF